MRGIAPGYEQKHFARGRVRRPAAPDRVTRRARRFGHDPPGRAFCTRRCSTARSAITHALAPGRRAYVHVARGTVTVNGEPSRRRRRRAHRERSRRAARSRPGRRGAAVRSAVKPPATATDPP
ncbi:MAG: hypothetical protein MZV65_29320 [Chromatiales bacterium]|nr:hypothetical protein [Chromatiales bacterium]